MSISFCQPMSLACTACGGACNADLWLILDAQEHPDLTSLLRENRLNQVTCPHCGHTFVAETALLFHDSAARRVIFAPPPGIEEYVWRDQARELHTVLVGSIPLEERRAYLGDVQIAQDVAGIAHILNKAARRAVQQTDTASPVDEPSQVQEPSTPPVTRMPEPENTVSPPEPPVSLPVSVDVPDVPPDTAVSAPGLFDVSAADETPPLLAAIEALLSINTPAEVQSVVEQHPLLLTASANAALSQLANVAVEQYQPDLADSLHQARQLLVQARASDPTMTTDTTVYREPAPEPAHGPDPQLSAVTQPPDTLSGPAATRPQERESVPSGGQPDLSLELYEALLAVETTEALQQLVQQQPVLLEPWVDTALSQTAEQLLDEGNESLTYQVELRREALAELRQAGVAPQVPQYDQPDMYEAIESLLVASGDEDGLAQVLLSYPVLLTDEAQAALWELSSDARAHGDESLAVYALECRAMLRKVSEGLSAP